MPVMIRNAAKRVLALLPPGVANSIKQRKDAALDRWMLGRSTAYDQRRYAAESGLFRLFEHQPSLEAHLIKTYHRVEKGLALRSPRPGFGRDAVEAILLACELHLRQWGSTTTVHRALNALDAYEAFNRQQGANLDWMQPRLRALRLQLPSQAAIPEGGTLDVTREHIHAAGLRDLQPFFASRYSIRQFAPEPVAQSLIEQAVRLAQKTPSVCNRESGRTYAIFDEAKRNKVLALQNGNRGFGDQAGCVLIITARLDTFLTVGERYQAWIDGGMYAMSIVYALHSLGLGSCCLNWSVEPGADMALREAAGLPGDAQVIMLLAVGHLPAAFKVAQSPRRALDEVLRIL